MTEKREKWTQAERGRWEGEPVHQFCAAAPALTHDFCSLSGVPGRLQSDSRRDCAPPWASPSQQRGRAGLHSFPSRHSGGERARWLRALSQEDGGDGSDEKQALLLAGRHKATSHFLEETAAGGESGPPSGPGETRPARGCFHFRMIWKPSPFSAFTVAKRKQLSSWKF